MRNKSKTRFASIAGIIALAIIATLFMIACKTEEDDPPPPTSIPVGQLYILPGDEGPYISGGTATVTAVYDGDENEVFFFLFDMGNSWDPKDVTVDSNGNIGLAPAGTTKGGVKSTLSTSKKSHSASFSSGITTAGTYGIGLIINKVVEDDDGAYDGNSNSYLNPGANVSVDPNRDLNWVFSPGLEFKSTKDATLTAFFGTWKMDGFTSTPAWKPANNYPAATAVDQYVEEVKINYNHFHLDSTYNIPASAGQAAINETEGVYWRINQWTPITPPSGYTSAYTLNVKPEWVDKYEPYTSFNVYISGSGTTLAINRANAGGAILQRKYFQTNSQTPTGLTEKQ